MRQRDLRVPAAGGGSDSPKGQRTLRALDEEPDIVWRTLREIEELVGTAPFKDVDAGSGVKLYVAFLSQRPRHKPKFPFASSKEGLEAIAMRGQEVFVVSRPKKNGFFGFPNSFIEKEFGISATTRNWSTVTRIAELARTEADGTGPFTTSGG